MQKILKFSYFFAFLAILSCGGTPSKERKDELAAPEQDDLSTEIKKGSEVILFFGTSLTAGMGLDPQEAYPAVIQQKIDSLDWNYTVVNAGLSGETTASGKNRLNWVLKQNTDVFVLELGANDGLRGIALSETRRNLQTIIDQVKMKNPDIKIVLAGMQIPPNMGEAYTSEFRKIFPELAKENDAALIPFLLRDVGGIPELNQEDGIHPTREGQIILAKNVWEVLQPLLNTKE